MLGLRIPVSDGRELRSVLKPNKFSRLALKRNEWIFSYQASCWDKFMVGLKGICLSWLVRTYLFHAANS